MVNAKRDIVTLYEEGEEEGEEDANRRTMRKNLRSRQAVHLSFP